VDLDALRAFLAVVESGSFVAAAAALRASRASVRRRIDELEAAVGAPLLVRSEQGASPTRAGVLLAERGRAILRETSSAMALVRARAASNAGTLRVALPVGLPPKLLSMCWSVVRASQPELRLDIRFAEDPVALLVQDIDIAVSFGDVPSEGPWVTQVIIRIPERLVASPAYLAEHGTPDSLDALAQHNLLLWQGPERRGHSLPLRAGGFHPVTPLLCATDPHALRVAASDGLGLLYTLDGGLPDDVGAGSELVPVLDDLIGAERAMRVVMPAGLREIPRILSAIDLLRTLARPVMLPPARGG
jgi:DNA-binding transcriptional LysR family regulator